MIPRAYVHSAPAGTGIGQDPELQDAAARFDRYLLALGRSPHTRRLYLAALRAWFDVGGAPGHIDGKRLAEWLAARRRVVGDSTIALQVKALRAWYRFAAMIGLAPDGEHRRLPTVRRARRRRMVRWLTEPQVRQLLEAPPLDSFEGLRDRVILRVLYDTGLRASECAALEISSILPDRTLYVVGKGRKARYVPFGEPLSEALAMWLQLRGTTRPGKTDALWVTRGGRPIRRGAFVWEVVTRYARQALGLAVGVERLRQAKRTPQRPWSGHYPHLLRASMATHLLEHDMPITAIAELLGHADVQTTGHYVGADLRHLRAAMAKHPRARRPHPREPSE